MPIFSRRNLQRLLDCVAPISPPGKIRDQIQRLNKGGQDAIATAWEIAVLCALRSAGSLTIEPTSASSNRVDFHLSLDCPNWTAAGDIVAVFDSGMHDESGYMAIETIVSQRIQAHRLLRTKFNLWLVGDVQGSERRQRIRLPPLRRAELVRDLDAFLQKVRAGPARAQEADLARRGHGFYLRYDPKLYSGGWSGTRIDAVYGIDANPLMSALKRKGNQLRRSGHLGPKVIVCCDGGSQALRSQRNRTWRTPSTEDIVQRFLAQTSSIVGVVLIIVDGSPLRAVVSARDREIYRIPVGINPHATESDLQALDQIVSALQASLPRVIRGPTSIPRPWSFKPDYRFFRFWEFKEMSASRIKIPVRALLELLAGELGHAEFVARYVSRGSPGCEGTDNIFSRWFDSGCLLSDARIYHEPESDDDWIELRCGDPDPALQSSFKDSSANV